MPSRLEQYQYNGARSLVLMHEKHMQDFLATWKVAKQHELRLPQTSDPNYASLETLLRHVLRAARGYMVWCCHNLKLPDPGIEPPPDEGRIAAQASSYLTHVLEKWRLPLREVAEKRFEEVFDSRWGVPYCIDAMLEHAVMHPIRHTFQLEQLLKKQ